MTDTSRNIINVLQGTKDLTLDDMTEILKQWCEWTGRPHISADDLLETTSLQQSAQHAFLSWYVTEWDRIQERSQQAARIAQLELDVARLDRAMELLNERTIAYEGLEQMRASLRTKIRIQEQRAF